MFRNIKELLFGKKHYQDFSDITLEREIVKPSPKKPLPESPSPEKPLPESPSPSLTTKERRQTDIRRPGGHIPSGKEIGPRPTPRPSSAEVDRASASSKEWLPGDHLGPAAQAGHDAMTAIKDKRFDDAWRYLHDQQSHYLAHASKFGFDAQGTLALAGSVHKNMANVMRLEGKHDQALMHMMYYIATAKQPPASEQKKLGSYFRRCKFTNTPESKLDLVMKALKSDPVFDAARGIVAQWRADER